MAHSNILLESGTNELEIVEFYLDEVDPVSGKVYKGYYGVNVAKVLEIIRAPKITEMPQVNHPSVLGAFNQRSHIIPLIDLAVWLGKERNESEPPKVVVTEFNKVTSAFLVSGVNRIHRLSWEQVEPPNKYVAEMSDSSFTGVVRIDEKIVFILDLEKIVADLNPELGMQLDEDQLPESSPNYRALVADDSATTRNMIKMLLEKADFTVQTADNGSEAWAKLSTLKHQVENEGKALNELVDVVISDIEMPSMDGHNLTKRIKDDVTLGKLPVILFSSLITDKLRHKGDAVGADDQISKPEVTQLAVRAKELIAKATA